MTYNLDITCTCYVCQGPNIALILLSSQPGIVFTILHDRYRFLQGCRERCHFCTMTQFVIGMVLFHLIDKELEFSLQNKDMKQSSSECKGAISSPCFMTWT